MEREHYRRVVKSGADGYTPRAERSQGETPKNIARGERILTQCVVCGIALAVLLIMSLINTPLTNGLRANLRSAIGGQTSMEQVRSVYDAVEGKIQSAFGETPATDAPASGGVQNPASSALNNENPGGKPDASANSVSGGVQNPASSALNNENPGAEHASSANSASGGVQNPDSSALNNENPGGEPDSSANSVSGGVQSPASSTGSASGARPSGDFRIDEDVLRDLNAS